MDWRDQGIMLNIRRHGENAAIIETFTPAHGRHAGMVRGGAGRRLAPILQPGAQLDLTWRARLEDHLGSFTVEPIRSRMAAALSGARPLAGLNAVLALLAFALPEREPHPRLYTHTETLLDCLGEATWPLAYLHWELHLLEDLGFGLDLRTCAVSGAVDNLIYVSPRSGRAVSAGAAGEWAARLLPLPACLLEAVSGGAATAQKSASDAPEPDIADALRTTGYFLEHRLAPSLGSHPLPAARARFAGLIGREA